MYSIICRLLDRLGLKYLLPGGIEIDIMFVIVLKWLWSCLSNHLQIAYYAHPHDLDKRSSGEGQTMVQPDHASRLILSCASALPRSLWNWDTQGLCNPNTFAEIYTVYPLKSPELSTHLWGKGKNSTLKKNLPWAVEIQMEWQFISHCMFS